MPRSDAWLPLVLLLLLALLSYWLSQTARVPAPGAERAPRHEPDAIVENFVAQQLGPQGELRYTLKARKMLHYPDDGTSSLESVFFEGREPDKAPFTVRSLTGRVTAKARDVYFLGDVVATQQSAEDTAPLTVRTSYLHVVPDAGVAKTDQPVVLQQGSGTINAESMELNNKTREARLTNVKATYLPQTPR